MRIKDSNSDIVQFRYQQIYGDGKVFPYIYMAKDNCLVNKEEAIRQLLTGPITFTVYNKLYKASVIKDILFPKNIGICEDLIFVYFALKQANKIAMTNEIYYNYCMEREDSATNLSVNSKTAIKAFEIIKDDLVNTYPNLIKTVNTLILNRLNSIYDRASKAVLNHKYKDKQLCEHLTNWSRLELKHRFKEFMLNSDCPKYRLVKSFLIIFAPDLLENIRNKFSNKNII